ncbi:AraC family transcriptional regulator [Carnobacterium divergens]|uniref:Transcription regulator n=2 Tax=Carnobacterium divergens TaxID=2748 RepID=A0A0R2HX68_CARDV|nr:AraC family transcriptional regulator [Carnobacterium divergens]ANZ99061.1 AraC family transcriptional regulator [Carnobacterium divergens]KRN56987.1 transcription regulator [Carnobacterium divergens DSM 20623]MDO0874789.1 AraC family transcriptional regulator [Carnobacterium divergens]MDT1959369.1 AraC family transcriptional regulator [Carnobacterium divergens]MDT1975336.1 AraC family transcriptional regulator [Carnobacterium divergens]
MLQLNPKTFNPEILYIFDYSNVGPTTGQNHAHDFLEMSIIIDGSVEYLIDEKAFLLEKETILLFNPGIHHYEHYEAGMESTQIHIGFRNFSLTDFPRDHFPFKTSILKLTKFKKEFFEVCQEILVEKAKGEEGYDLMLKTLVMKLIIYILRDAESNHLEINALKLSYEEQEKQTIVSNIIHYLEKHHTEDVSLSSLSQTLYISPTYISRVFKEETGESPINYLIKLRLTRAKELLENQEDITVKEAANLVGYNDAYYFSKLFKKYYGKPPSVFIRNKH